MVIHTHYDTTEGNLIKNHPIIHFDDYTPKHYSYFRIHFAHIFQTFYRLKIHPTTIQKCKKENVKSRKMGFQTPTAMSLIDPQGSLVVHGLLPQGLHSQEVKGSTAL